MKLLVDAHALLWWVTSGGSRLSSRAMEILSDPTTDALVGAGALYEIAFKSAVGRLQLPGRPEVYLSRLLRRHSFAVLPIEESHALRAASLPLIHRDPWDRLLVAQAQVENLPILSADPAVSRYDVEVIW